MNPEIEELRARDNPHYRNEETMISKPKTADAKERDELFAKLHRFNPFGGYDRPHLWAKTPTQTLRETLGRYEARAR